MQIEVQRALEEIRKAFGETQKQFAARSEVKRVREAVGDAQQQIPERVNVLKAILVLLIVLTETRQFRQQWLKVDDAIADLHQALSHDEPVPDTQQLPAQRELYSLLSALRKFRRNLCDPQQVAQYLEVAGAVREFRKASDEDPRLAVHRAVRTLRKTLGDTQQKFATRLGLAISTVVRYELSRPPKGPSLAMFERLASEHGRQDLAQVFQRALVREIEVFQPGRTRFIAPEGQEAEVAAFINALQLPRLASTRAQVLKLLKAEVESCRVQLGAVGVVTRESGKPNKREKIGERK